MNILYISCLYGEQWAGPTKSVPNQITAQKKNDDVLWFNVNGTGNWSENINYFNSKDVPRLNINNIPKPFNKPDLVIFQGVYFWKFCFIASKLRKKNIPYIIVPRSSLTSSAQNSKKFKKKLGNIFLFKHFIQNALAIEYLTKEEYNESNKSWNNTSIIIPNGIDRKSNTKNWKKKKSIKGVFIARLDVYHKGIDILLEACSEMKEEMKAANFTINIYGSDRNGSRDKIKELIDQNALNSLVIVKDAVFGEEKEKILLDSDIFILTSRFEGQPMGLLEALSYGVPCLVSEGTNMAREIYLNDAGWTAEINKDSIKEALLRMINDISNFEIKGKNAIELANNYNWEEIGKISHSKYTELKRL